MGKKHKKRSSYLEYYGKKSKKKSKKSGYGKTEKYARPNFRDVKPTLDKADIKANRKTVLMPVEVPKSFTKARRKCNHAGRTMSVAEYKTLTPNYAAYTPMLDTMIEVFGIDNVEICRDCYDVLVNIDMITPDQVIKAVATLYGAANVAVSTTRLKKDEVKKINDAKTALDQYRTVHSLVSDTWKRTDDKDASDSDMSALNRETSGAFVS